MPHSGKPISGLLENRQRAAVWSHRKFSHAQLADFVLNFTQTVASAFAFNHNGYRPKTCEVGSMGFRSYEMLHAHRADFLSRAISDVKKWCVLPDQRVERRKRSDQYWVRLFNPAHASNITSSDADDFLYGFGLSRFTHWNSDGVAKAVGELAAISDFSPAKAIPSFVMKLRNLNERKTQQTSAASKIANFAHPTAKVYIWDRLARNSAFLRDNKHFGAQLEGVNWAALYTNGREHDYAAYYGACARVHSDEIKNDDFKEAVRQLDIHFQDQRGQLADRSKIPLDFIERRLLDKLMFWEGWAVDRGKLPR